MVKIKTISDFPKEYGEDRNFIGDGIYGVIDGSSPIQLVDCNGFTSQAEWFAERLAQNVLFYEGSIPERFKSAVKSLEVPSLPDKLLPCAVAAGVSIQDGYLKCYALGDCTILVELQDGTWQIITDDRISQYLRLTVIARNEAKARGLDEKEAVRKQMNKNRESMNSEGGFWTVAFKGDFSKEFVNVDFKLEDVKSCLIFSDGFARVFDIGIFFIRDILSERISLVEAIESLREYEKQQDIDEVKRHDDASAILLKF